MTHLRTTCKPQAWMECKQHTAAQPEGISGHKEILTTILKWFCCRQSPSWDSRSHWWITSALKQHNMLVWMLNCWTTTDFNCVGRADTIIPTVQESDSYDQFPGLYCPALKPRQLSFINNNRFLIGSAWRSSIQVSLLWLHTLWRKGLDIWRHTSLLSNAWWNTDCLRPLAIHAVRCHILNVTRWWWKQTSVISVLSCHNVWLGYCEAQAYLIFHLKLEQYRKIYCTPAQAATAYCHKSAVWFWHNSDCDWHPTVGADRRCHHSRSWRGGRGVFKHKNGRRVHIIWCPWRQNG